jgi:hypothetical protein
MAKNMGSIPSLAKWSLLSFLFFLGYIVMLLSGLSIWIGDFGLGGFIFQIPSLKYIVKKN